MGKFIYVSKKNCGTCEYYEKHIDFKLLRDKILKYTDTNIRFIKVIGNDFEELSNIHMALIRIEMFPTLFYIDDSVMELKIPSLELPKIHGQIFEDRDYFMEWVITITDTRNTNISDDFFSENKINHNSNSPTENIVKTFESSKSEYELYNILNIF